MSKQDDRALRFYNEVLGLSSLHYGVWQPDDAVTIDNLRLAQSRYDEMLLENIPEGVQDILDVGCGTGLLARKLVDSGYRVEGLSPDDNQKTNFTDNIKLPFHHMMFEDFTAQDRFDCIIMSESSQYINMDKLFDNAERALRPGGYLMVCDYFVLNNAPGIFSKSGHNYDAFMERMARSRFAVLQNKDITEATLKTLVFASDFIDRIILAYEIGTEKLRRKYAFLFRMLSWLLRKKIAKYEQEKQVLDPELFHQYKTYRFLLLQLDAS